MIATRNRQAGLPLDAELRQTPRSPWAHRMIRAVGALLLATGLWVFWGADAWYELPSAPATAAVGASTAAQSIAQGDYLARIGNCALCHTAPGGAAFAGGRAIETPFGAVISSNITPDPAHGIGQWSADDFWRALHHGKSRDGRRLSPAFPYTSYTRVSRADADALFAYLRTVAPSPRANTASFLTWPFNTQAALAVWRALYFRPQAAPPAGAADGDGAAPAKSASGMGADDSAGLARGAYLVHGLGHCTECHGARSLLGGLQRGAEFAGAVLPGLAWYAPSLQSADQAGATSVADTVALLQTGTSGQRWVNGPMAEVVLHGTQHLTDADAQAIALYLQAVAQPATAKPAASASAQRPLATNTDPRAAQLYADQCADCHGKEGQGQPGAYPALAGNRAVVMAPPNNPVLSVLHGGFAPATAGNPRPFGMPPFLLQLSDADVAAVLTHVRSAWGNQGAPVSALEVQQIRRTQAAP